MTTAVTIFDQLGASRFAAMTGARDILDVGNGLRFKLGRGAKDPSGRAVNIVTIKLDADDTYTVEYGYWRGMNYTRRVTSTGVYADSLRDDFERNTGLFTSLGTMGR